MNHDETFTRLVRDYAASLADKVATLDRSLAEAQTGHAPALAKAREVAHRMRGTAGCYGFRDLSDAAGVLDEILTALQRGEGGSWPEAERSAAVIRTVAEAARRSQALSP